MLWRDRCNAVPLTEGAPVIRMDHGKEVPVTATDFSATGAGPASSSFNLAPCCRTYWYVSSFVAHESGLAPIFAPLSLPAPSTATDRAKDSSLNIHLRFSASAGNTPKASLTLMSLLPVPRRPETNQVSIIS